MQLEIVVFNNLTAEIEKFDWAKKILEKKFSFYNTNNNNSSNNNDNNINNKKMSPISLMSKDKIFLNKNMIANTY